jgi:hypothetical protein
MPQLAAGGVGCARQREPSLIRAGLPQVPRSRQPSVRSSRGRPKRRSGRGPAGVTRDPINRRTRAGSNVSDKRSLRENRIEGRSVRRRRRCRQHGAEDVGETLLGADADGGVCVYLLPGASFATWCQRTCGFSANLPRGAPFGVCRRAACPCGSPGSRLRRRPSDGGADPLGHQGRAQQDEDDANEFKMNS